jgi:hypothetical protein
MLNNFGKEPIVYDYKNTIVWLQEHKHPADKTDMVIKLLDEEILVKPIADIVIHIKRESLLKDGDKNVTNMSQENARTIMWQRYAVAAIFSPIFLEAKNRLKHLLNNKTIYSDGLSPQDLNKILCTFDYAEYFYENDLSKQDKQTDDHLIEMELYLYKLLGVHSSVLDLWENVHKEWKWSTNYARGWCKSMRLTGQATTALGNLITNLQVHADIVSKNKEQIVCSLFLGDDSLIISRKPLHGVHKLQDYIKQYFNMLSEIKLNHGFGTFVRLILYYNSDSNLECGPDLIRLKLRYEVFNSCLELDVEQRLTRRLSYGQMIGPTTAVIKFCQQNGVPSPTVWYDFQANLSFLSQKYNVPMVDVLEARSWLEEMIVTDSHFVKKVETWLDLTSR